MKWDARNVCTKLKANEMKDSENLRMQSSRGMERDRNRDIQESDVHSKKFKTLKFERTEEQLWLQEYMTGKWKYNLQDLQ